MADLPTRRDGTAKGVPNKPAANRAPAFTGTGPTGPATIPHGFSSGMPTGPVAKRGTIIAMSPRGNHRGLPMLAVRGRRSR